VRGVRKRFQIQDSGFKSKIRNLEGLGVEFRIARARSGILAVLVLNSGFQSEVRNLEGLESGIRNLEMFVAKVDTLPTGLGPESGIRNVLS